MANERIADCAQCQTYIRTHTAHTQTRHSDTRVHSQHRAKICDLFTAFGFASDLFLCVVPAA